VRGPLPDGLDEGGITRVVDGAEHIVAMVRLQGGRLHPDKVFSVPGS
jgi:hypothetical protein